MANGLLDFFGKDYEDPRTQGLLQFGLGLMQQGGYQDRPVSLGQAFGAAGQQGMQAYQQAVADKQRKEQLAQAKRLQDLQEKTAQQTLKEKQAQQLAVSRFQTAQRMGFRDMAGNPMSQSQIDALTVSAYPELGSYRAKKEIDKEFVSPKEPEYGIYQFGDQLLQTVDGRLGDVLMTKPKEDLDPLKIERAAELLGLNPDSEEYKDFIRSSFVKGDKTDISVTIDPDGDGRVPLDKVIARKKQEEVLKNTATYDRLSRIEADFEPEFLQYFPKIGFGIDAFVEKLGSELSPDQAQQLTKFTNFQRNSIAVVNQYIKDITGAQMSIQEAERIMRGMPNPDQDSPTQFKAKLESVMEELDFMRKRSKYFIANGIDVLTEDVVDGFDGSRMLNTQHKVGGLTVTTEKDLDTLVDKELNSIAKEYVASGMSEEQAARQAFNDINQKYNF